MRVYSASVATDERFDLAEGITWDENARRVRWVDIREGRLCSGYLSGQNIENIETVSLGETTGAIALAEDGGFIVAGALGLIALSPDGSVSRGPELIPSNSRRRLNDGKVDPFGSFVVGSLSLDDKPGEEVLLRVTPDGSVSTLRDGLGLSNGLGFSPDGSTIYHIDTFAKTLSSHSYGAQQFDQSEPWRVVLSKFDFYPDGMTVDSSGALWVAMWGGSRVERYSPDGDRLAIVELDAVNATCPSFVGANLGLLGITTALKGVHTVTDSSGALFVVDVGVVGLRPYRWAGSTTNPSWPRSVNNHQGES